MLLIVGLGNPGKEYEKTRHNIGFAALDVLAARHGIEVSKKSKHALVGDGQIGGKKVLLAKPQTYMNDSGLAVQELVSFYKLAAEDFAIVYDDIDIAAGTLRVRAQGSAGTHNGMRDIIYKLGFDDFPRFRIGVGAERGKRPLKDFVLSRFEEDETEKMKAATERCADALEAWISEGIEPAMQKFNGA